MKAFLYAVCRWMATFAIIAVIIQAAGKTSRTSSASPQDVFDAVCGSAVMTNMQPAPNQIIKRFYGIDPKDYQFCELYYPLSNMDVDELLVIRFADSSQEQRVKEAAESRLAGQKNVFESYGVEQMELLSNHSIYISDSGYAMFIVNAGAEEARDAFINAVRGK